MQRSTRTLCCAAGVILISACAGDLSGTPADSKPNLSQLHPVKPVVRHASAIPELQVALARFFSYARPAGWQLGEDGQFALTLIAPDKKALTIMVGNAGMPPNYNPGQYVYERLMALRPQNLKLGQPKAATPVSGFRQAYEFPVSYLAGGVPCRGVAKANISVAYDSAVYAITAALSEESQWAGYSSWLPSVADQVSALNGSAFGARGVMAQNLRNSQEFAEAAQRYRNWSQQTWQQVRNERDASLDRRNFQFRENLGNVQSYVNPYDTRTPLELPNNYKYFWVDRSGNVLGTDDPGANPNVGSTGDWKQMSRYRP